MEHSVLRALCHLGSASVWQVHERVGKELAYTTIAKILERLRTKGMVTRSKIGRGFQYSSSLPRREFEKAWVRRWLDELVDEKPRAAMAGLVDAVDSINPDLLDELSRLIAKRRRSRRGS